MVEGVGYLPWDERNYYVYASLGPQGEESVYL